MTISTTRLSTFLSVAATASLLICAGTALANPVQPASSSGSLPAATKLSTLTRAGVLAPAPSFTPSSGSNSVTPPAPRFSVAFATGGSVGGANATDLTLSGIETPVMTNNGKVAFIGEIAGAGVGLSNNIALMAADGSITSLLIRTGAVLPGMATGVVSSIDDMYISPAGHVAAMTRFNNTATTVTGINKALVRFNPLTSAMETVARTGLNAPGITNARFKDITTPSFNASGRVLFSASVTAPGIWAGQDRGLFTDSSGSLALVARQLGNVPGMASTIRFASLGMGSLNDNGQIAFVAFLQGSGINANNDACVFTTNTNMQGAAMTLAARRGQFLAGSSGPTYRVFNAPAINNAGDLAFMGTMDGVGAGTSSNIFARSAATGSISGLVRTGQWSSALPNSQVWGIHGSPVLAGDGRMAFLATINGASVTQDNDIGLFTADAGTVRMVAREGSAVPGMSSVVFGSFQPPTMNSRGQLLIAATLAGAGVTASNNSAVFTFDPIAGFTRIVRTGDSITVNGAARVVTEVRCSTNAGGQDGKPSSLNTNGNFVVLAKYLSGAAVLTGRIRASPADFASASGLGNDGRVNQTDLTAYLGAFAAGNMAADIASNNGQLSPDGQLNSSDMSAFTTAYAAVSSQ